MIGFFLRHFAGTITIARMDKQLRAELARRAEYAMRFQIHSPDQFSPRTLALLIGLIAAMAIYCFV